MKDHRGTSRWRRRALEVIARDGGICWICGRPGATSADHLVPQSLGGTDAPSNLRAAHVGCNTARGNRLHPLRPRALGSPSRAW